MFLHAFFSLCRSALHLNRQKTTPTLQEHTCFDTLNCCVCVRVCLWLQWIALTFKLVRLHLCRIDTRAPAHIKQQPVCAFLPRCTAPTASHAPQKIKTVCYVCPGARSQRLHMHPTRLKLCARVCPGVRPQRLYMHPTRLHPTAWTHSRKASQHELQAGGAAPHAVVSGGRGLRLNRDCSNSVERVAQ